MAGSVRGRGLVWQPPSSRTGRPWSTQLLPGAGAYLMATLYVRPAGPRPDFRLVLAFLWGDAADCDTDGNARHPADREWTELYAQNRTRPGEVFDVVAANVDPVVLEVASPLEWLAAAVAYLLAETTAGSVASDPSGPFTPAASALPRATDFDVRAAWARYRDSPFRRSTADNPYPNLET